MIDPAFHEQPRRPSPDDKPEAHAAYAARQAAAVAATDNHLQAARHQAVILVDRARTLVRNGVDLRHPERALDFIGDQVRDAVERSRLPNCGCGGSTGTAGFTLIAELARLLAETDRDGAR